MHVDATFCSMGPRLQEKYTKEEYQQKKSREVVIFHVCVGAP
jgi:hypothetical protein